MSQDQPSEGAKKQQKSRRLPKQSGVKQQEQVVSTQRWVNQDTGEERVFTVIDRSQMGDYGFHKVWLEDLSRIIGVLGGAKMKVFSYILDNIRSNTTTTSPIAGERGSYHISILASLNSNPIVKIKLLCNTTILQSIYAETLRLYTSLFALRSAP